MKSVIAAIDFSFLSERVIKAASELVAVTSGKLWLLHIAAPDSDLVGMKIGPKHDRDWRASTLHMEHRDLRDRGAFRDQRRFSYNHTRNLWS